jgi:hypothetical protein
MYPAYSFASGWGTRACIAGLDASECYGGIESDAGYDSHCYEEATHRRVFLLIS